MSNHGYHQRGQMLPLRRHGDKVPQNGLVNTIPRPHGVSTQHFHQKDFAVHSQYDVRTNMTKDIGINKREMFEKKFGVPAVYTREHFRPDTIINANHFEEAWNHSPTVSYAETLVVGNAGEKICTKRRCMIVVAQNDSCYTTVPVFTFQGQGLSQKSAKHECVSVRDHKIRAKDFVPLSHHAPLVTKHLKDPVGIKEESTAWVAYPVSRQYFLPVTLTGRLDEGSTKGLIELYQKIHGIEGQLFFCAVSNSRFRKRRLRRSGDRKRTQREARRYRHNASRNRTTTKRSRKAGPDRC